MVLRDENEKNCDHAHVHGNRTWGRRVHTGQPLVSEEAHNERLAMHEDLVP